MAETSEIVSSAVPEQNGSPHHGKCLIHSVRAGVSALSLKFEDGYSGTVDYVSIGFEPHELDLGVVRVTSSKDGIDMALKEGQSFVMDAETLRYFADAEYAYEVDREVERCHISPERFDKLLETSRPPQSWYDEVQPKLW